MRICISITITEMVPPLNHNTTKSSIDNTCPARESFVSSPKNHNQTIVKANIYNWDEGTQVQPIKFLTPSENVNIVYFSNQQGLILSSFYWGYVLTNILGGFTLNKLGGKHTLGFGILSTSLLTLITPLVIDWGGASALIWLRLVMGACEGAMYPAVLRLMAHWIPEDERSWAGSLAFSGFPVGTIVGMAASGAMIQRSHIGWPIVFYFYGGLGLIIYLLHCVLCYDSPDIHPFICKSEASYLAGKLSEFLVMCLEILRINNKTKN